MVEVIPKDGNVKVNGLNIHYLDWGGNGMPVIQVPGMTGSCWFALNVAESLIPEYRALAYDIRGRGDSDKPTHGYNLIAHACDLEAFLNALEIEQAVLFGHSLGASISLFFAVYSPHRVSKLILGDWAKTPSPAEAAALLKSPIADRLRTTFDSLESYLNTMPSLLGVERNRYIDKAYTFDVEVLADGRVKPKIPAEAVVEEFSSMVAYDLEPLYPRVKCPTLFLRSPEPAPYTGKVLVTREEALRIVESIPDCRLVDVQGTHHSTLFLGDQKRTAEAILSFLRE
jgi:pimeloyl-ACP methyl ester carboxylesterase